MQAESMHLPAIIAPVAAVDWPVHAVVRMPPAAARVVLLPGRFLHRLHGNQRNSNERHSTLDRHDDASRFITCSWAASPPRASE